MFTCTSFTVVIVYDESPRLVPCLEPLRNARDSVRLGLGWAMVVIKRDVDLSTLVISCLRPICQLWAKSVQEVEVTVITTIEG